MVRAPATFASATPVTALHYTANGNITSSGAYLPGALGFNLADISASWVLRYLPTGVKALVWLGDCGGARSSFQSQVHPFLGSTKVWTTSRHRSCIERRSAYVNRRLEISD